MREPSSNGSGSEPPRRLSVRLCVVKENISGLADLTFLSSPGLSGPSPIRADEIHLAGRAPPAGSSFVPARSSSPEAEAWGVGVVLVLAVVTKYHKLAGLYKTEIYFSWFRRLEVHGQGASTTGVC